MNVLEHLVQTRLASALGWTLFHSLWEGALAALFLLAVLLATRSPRVRYVCSCAAMGGLLVAFAITLGVSSKSQGEFGSIPAVFVNTVRNGDAIRFNIPANYALDYFLPWLAPFWIAGVVALLLRRAAGWIRTQRLRTSGVCRPPDPWPQRLDALRARLRVLRPVILMETSLAEVPVVVGYLSPVILVPAGLLAGIPSSQMEAILLHELAHIRRHDALVNLFQNVAESLLFYHPAAWWISSVIRAEREKCCDDLAVAANGDTLEYAAALTALEQRRTAYPAALAASGGSLVKRIRRLLNPEARLELAPLLSAGTLLVLAAGALIAWQSAATKQSKQPVTPYTLWMNEDVAYIITPEERTALQKLQTDEERGHFIEQFWMRRDPTPDTVRNEFKEEHYRRIAYANEHFSGPVPGWKSDRGRIYIVYGPPDGIEDHSANQPPNEQWLYHFIPGIGQNVIIEFVDPAGTGEYKMTSDPAVPR